MQAEDWEWGRISPYLRRPLRSQEEVLAQRVVPMRPQSRSPEASEVSSFVENVSSARELKTA